MGQTEQFQKNGDRGALSVADTAVLRLHHTITLLAEEQLSRLPGLLIATFVLGAIYLAALVFWLPEPFWFELSIFAALSLLVVALLFVQLRRRVITARNVLATTGWLATVIFANLLLRLLLLGEGGLLPLLALFIFFTGLITLATFWYLELIILSAGGAVLAYLFHPAAGNWLLYGVLLAGAAACGLLAQRRTLHLLQKAMTAPLPTVYPAKNGRGEAGTAVTTPDALTQQLQTSIAIGQQITAILHMEALLASIASLLHEQFQLYFVAVYLPHRNGVGMKSYAQAGSACQDGPLSLHVGLRGQIGWVMAHGKPLRLDDVSKDLTYDPAEKAPHTRSALILPLRIADKVLGVLDLQSDRLQGFAEEDLPLYQSLANQIAIALENARLYAEVKAFNTQLEAMVDERTEALQVAYAQLRRLDQTKADFITIASHELRTPLTVASINAQLIMQDTVLREHPRYVKWAGGIVRGVERMETIVQTMLDVAKIDSGALELSFTRMNLRPLLVQVVDSLRRGAAKRQIRIKLGKMGRITPLRADPDALQKLFYHLLSNAIKYTPDGGEILIDAQSAITEKLDGGKQKALEIVVADNGIGIDPEVQALIFEKFYQTGEVSLHSSGALRFKGGGAGLGLAIVKGLVEAHGGLVWVESPGRDEERCPGAVFHVLLPLDPTAVLPPPATSPAEPAAAA